MSLRTAVRERVSDNFCILRELAAFFNFFERTIVCRPAESPGLLNAAASVAFAAVAIIAASSKSKDPPRRARRLGRYDLLQKKYVKNLFLTHTRSPSIAL